VDFKQLAAARGPAGFNERVPLGQLPTLTLPDGSVHVQSASVARWAGKKGGALETRRSCGSRAH